ncbi:MAG: hypothetical protein DWQ01_17190 [Planctomycetota bacterium]|nr:MAG: hypothetical protein DWQ01_17190 [Planctomycetota bacterium]
MAAVALTALTACQQNQAREDLTFENRAHNRILADIPLISHLFTQTQQEETPVSATSSNQEEDPMGRALARVEMELLEQNAESEEFNVVGTPILSTFAGDRASIQVMNQLAYVSHFKVEYQDSGAVLADPEVEVFDEGISVEIMPLKHASGRWAAGAEVTVTRLNKMEVVDMMLGPSQVSVQVPEAESLTRHLWLEANADGLWFVPLGQMDNGNNLFLRIKIREERPKSSSSPEQEAATK